MQRAGAAGWRWSGEMEEIAATCRDAGLPADTFLSIKRYELDRYHRHVSEWDIAEYAHHL